MDLSILIVTFNSSNFIESAINSIQSSITKYTYEVIIVDNNSSDGTPQILKDKYSDLKLIFQNYNYGFANGMNKAFQSSEGRYILSFNPDAELKTDSIERVISYLELKDSVGLVGGSVENSEGEIEMPATGHPLLPIRFYKGLFRQTANPSKIKSIKTDVIWGTGLVTRSDLLDDGILFQEVSFLFGEEYYLARKILSKSKEVLVYPDFRLKHHKSVSFKFDEFKTILAIKLKECATYKINYRKYGLFLSKVASLVLSIDSILLIIRVYIGSIRKKNTTLSKRMIKKYKAMFIVRLYTLLIGHQYCASINRTAEAYFNKQ
ncbi:glycosyltransferase [Ekhidna sp.]|uniref:glycosyltransferase n=1 Tax=Ekhidna sp. TaxID=2608089 RepID=UPI003BAABC57